MPDRLFKLYQRRRWININANVVAAGLISTLMVMGLIWGLKWLGTSWPTWGYTAFSVAADVVLDVALFSALHWVANHWRPLSGKSNKERLELGAVAPPHLEDTARVQLERAVLSPLYYVIAAAGTEGLQRLGMHPAWAVVIAYPVGLLVTRTVHTVWGFRSGPFEDHHVQVRRRRIRDRKRARSDGSHSDR